jgi:hypothetical protein
MNKIISFISSHILQSLLAIVAFYSWTHVIELGSKTYGQAGKIITDLDNLVFTPTDVDVAAGFEGGALAMGLVCCVCIIMIVWLEINKNPKP